MRQTFFNTGLGIHSHDFAIDEFHCVLSPGGTDILTATRIPLSPDVHTTIVTIPTPDFPSLDPNAGIRMPSNAIPGQVIEIHVQTPGTSGSPYYRIYKDDNFQFLNGNAYYGLNKASRWRAVCFDYASFPNYSNVEPKSGNATGLLAVHWSPVGFGV
jgi:hypothetical protein